MKDTYEIASGIAVSIIDMVNTVGYENIDNFTPVGMTETLKLVSEIQEAFCEEEPPVEPEEEQTPSVFLVTEHFGPMSESAVQTALANALYVMKEIQGMDSLPKIKALASTWISATSK